jgi:hypothetical protein
MHLAFRKVCEAMHLDCKPDVIVEKIIEHARARETDPERLCSFAAKCWSNWQSMPRANKSGC